MRRSAVVLPAVGLTVMLGPVLGLRGQTAPPGQTRTAMPHGEIRLECSECHDPERWTPVATGRFRHETTGFVLESAHRQASCRGCHPRLEFARVGTACADCHRDAHRGELGARCESCHTPAGWTNQREIFRVHARSRFPLMSVHARLDCAACHRNQQPHEYANTPAECGNCHYQTWLATTSPNHRQAGYSRNCQECHGTAPSSWHDAVFAHPASFPLSGGHAGVACARCHTSGQPGPISSACVSCHQDDYQRTTNPNHAAGSFPTTCQSCHSINGWRPAVLDHAKTRFPLTGAHATTACDRCHVGGRYTGTPTDCYSCHRPSYDATTNPNHQAAGFPTQCQTCHTTSAWRPASFSHDKTRFPLTGAHTRVECARCHVGGRYTGTPTDCYSCHQANYAATTNPNHQAAGFPTQCQNCHTTDAWRPASFDHDGLYFPIYSGAHRGRWSSCGECHVNPSSYKAFECILCHEHANRAEVDKDHREVGGYVYASSACYQCHRNGRADALGRVRRLERGRRPVNP